MLSCLVLHCCHKFLILVSRMRMLPSRSTESAKEAEARVYDTTVYSRNIMEVTVWLILTYEQ